MTHKFRIEFTTVVTKLDDVKKKVKPYKVKSGTRLGKFSWKVVIHKTDDEADEVIDTLSAKKSIAHIEELD